MNQKDHMSIRRERQKQLDVGLPTHTASARSTFLGLRVVLQAKGRSDELGRKVQGCSLEQTKRREVDENRERARCMEYAARFESACNELAATNPQLTNHQRPFLARSDPSCTDNHGNLRSLLPIVKRATCCPVPWLRSCKAAQKPLA